MHACVLQFEILIALTIMLKVEGAMEAYNPWVAYLTMNFQNLFSRRKILSKAFNSHTVCYIVINNFFGSFQISAGPYNPSQNTLRLINKFEKCIPSFMQSLIADFIQFSRAIVKFLFLQGRLSTRLCVHSIS